MEQAGETARGDVEVERVAQQVGDLRQRDAHLGVHFDHEADDSGAELYAGRTQRVGGLQGVSALHPPPALRAVPDLDIETPHKGAHLRQVLPDTATPPGSRQPRRRSPDTPSAPAPRRPRRTCLGRGRQPCRP